MRTLIDSWTIYICRRCGSDYIHQNVWPDGSGYDGTWLCECTNGFLSEDDVEEVRVVRAEDKDA